MCDKCDKGAADVFLEMITQPFPGSDGICTGLIQPIDRLMRSWSCQRMQSSIGTSTPSRVCPPMPRIDGLRPHASEEPLRGGVVRGTAFGARRPRRAVAVHERQPSGPPAVASAVGMHQGPRSLRQRFHGLDEHPVGELRVGTGPGRVRDDLAVVTVDRRGEVHLPIPGLDLGDVREPFLVRHLSREIAVGEVAGSRRGLALV